MLGDSYLQGRNVQLWKIDLFGVNPRFVAGIVLIFPFGIAKAGFVQRFHHLWGEVNEPWLEMQLHENEMEMGLPWAQNTGYLY